MWLGRISAFWGRSGEAPGAKKVNPHYVFNGISKNLKKTKRKKNDSQVGSSNSQRIQKTIAWCVLANLVTSLVATFLDNPPTRTLKEGAKLKVSGPSGVRSARTVFPALVTYCVS